MSKRKNDDERLDDNSIERVIAYLNEKGATKKQACAILNIAYNTARLDKLIENYKSKKEDDARRRSEKRGKPATPQEINFVITESLAGEPVDRIAKSLYRGTTFVNSILEQYHVPRRNTSRDYRYPELIPEEAMRDKFSVGEIVFSARYSCLAKICSEFSPKVYSILVKDGEDTYYAYQPAEELASLQHLRDKGITI